MKKAYHVHKLECSGGIDLDGGNDGGDKLEENDEIEINSQTLDLFFIPCRPRGFLPLLAATTEDTPLLLGLFGIGAGALAESLLFLDAAVHTFDNLLHHACVFAWVYGRRSQVSGVGERFNGHCLECMVGGNILEDLRWGEGGSVLRHNSVNIVVF